jgi:TrmH family RNA methyltransferase
MIIDKITSRQNPLVKRFRAVRQEQERHLVMIEGVRLVAEAINAQLHFEAVAYTEQLHASERGNHLYQQLIQLPCRGALVTDAIMNLMSDVESPQGVAAIAQIPYAVLDDAIVKDPPLIVIAHQLKDPGNLGTIIRTAEAAGADSLITTAGTVNPFNLKALRAAMGSAFRLPIITHKLLPEIAQFCHKAGLRLVAADIHGASNYTDFNWRGPVALLLGQEASGIDEAAAAFVQEKVAIPMASSVESLNVGAASAILLYEAARQRHFHLKGGQKVTDEFNNPR